MYPGQHARLRPLQPAFIMAATGEAVTYRELDARSNRLAHLFRKHGLKRLDHYSIFMENNSRYLEACGAGERSGLYYTCINSFLTAGELAYLLTNSQSKILITSVAKLDIAREAIKSCPDVKLCVVADGPGESERPAPEGAERQTARGGEHGAREEGRGQEDPRAERDRGGGGADRQEQLAQAVRGMREQHRCGAGGGHGGNDEADESA